MSSGVKCQRAAAPTCLFPYSLSRPQNPSLHCLKLEEAQEGWTLSPRSSVPGDQPHLSMDSQWPPNQPQEAHTNYALPLELLGASGAPCGIFCPDSSLTPARASWHSRLPLLMLLVRSKGLRPTRHAPHTLPQPCLPRAARWGPCCPHSAGCPCPRESQGVSLQ